MVTLLGARTKFKWSPCVVLAVCLSVLPSSVAGRRSHQGYGLSPSSFNDHFENYYDANTYLSSQQRVQYEEYWNCVLSGKIDYIHQSLRWMAQHGHFDDYFMALNYLVYVHDNHLKNPQLIQIIERLIDDSVQKNIIQSSVVMTNSVTYNIVKYLLSRFRPTVEETVHEVPYYTVDFQAINPADIERLIHALGSHHGRYYSIMVSYLKSLPASIYQQLDFTQPAGVCLKKLLSILISGQISISPELYQAANYYLVYLRNRQLLYQARQMNMQTVHELVNFLPDFPSPHRDILIQFLTSGDMIPDLIKLAGKPVASESYLCNLLLTGLSYSKITGPIHDAFQFYANYFQNVNLFGNLSYKLPKFTSSPGKDYYNLLYGYFHGPEFHRILGTTELGYLDLHSAHILQDTLSLLRSDTHVSSEIKAAASYYLKYYKILEVRDSYCLSQLSTMIPHATLATEKVFYDTIQAFFSSNSLLKILLESQIAISTDNMAMLHDIFNYALKSSFIKVEYKHAILHYLEIMFNEGVTIEQQQKIEYLLEEFMSLRIDTIIYEQIATFMRSDLMYIILSQNSIDFSESSFVVLQHIFEAISHTSCLETTIIEAATFSLQKVESQYSLETEIITKIYQAFVSLQGVSETKAAGYQAEFNVFLQCNEMHTIIRNSHLDINKDANELLYDVLCILEEDINVSMNIREGAYYYCKYILEPLLGNMSFNSEELLSLVPQPTNDFTQQYYSILKSYLQLGIPRYLAPQIDFAKTRVDLLINILQAIEHCDRIPVDVRGSARYYWHFFSKNQIHVDINFLKNKLDRLSLLLPKPTTIHEAQYYNLMVGYLKGEQLLKLLNTISISFYKPDEQILRDILVLTLNTKNLFMDIKIVGRYYLTMIDNGVIGNISHVIQQVEHVQESVMSTQAAILHGYQSTEQASTNVQTSHQTTLATAGTTATTVGLSTSNAFQAVQAGQATTSTVSRTVSSTQQTMTSKASSMRQSSAEVVATSSSVASTMSTQQLTVLGTIEQELIQLEVSDTYISDRQVILGYLKSELAYNLLESAGVDMTASGSVLLTQFIQIAAHTTDIAADLRLACERYEQVIPELKDSALITPSVHIVRLDNIFHEIDKSCVEGASSEVLIAYNAIDRYLHSQVPSSILDNVRVDLKIAPTECLQDYLVVCEVCAPSPESVTVIQDLLKQNLETAVDRSLLEHLYRLHKVFQLFTTPEDTTLVEHYYTMSTFMNGNIMFQHWSSLDFTMDLKEIQRAILSMIISSPETTFSKDVLESALYYNNLLFTPTIEAEVQDVFHLVPKPEEELGVQAYDAVNEYIHSPAAVEVTKNVNYDVQRQPEAILTNVLDLTSHSARAAPKVRSAARYLLRQIVIPSAIVIPTKRTIITQRYVHPMRVVKKVVSVQQVRTQSYAPLLNVLPSTFAFGEEYTIIQQYFSQLNSATITSYINQEELSSLQNNEEGLFRLILLRVILDVHQSESLRIAFAHIIKQRYFDFSGFVSLIPAATMSEEETQRSILVEFFSGDSVYEYVDLSHTEYDISMESFITILTTLSTSETLSASIKEACLYYMRHTPFFDVQELIMQLPEPTTSNIKKLYSTMVDFLNNKDLIYKCAEHVDLTQYIDSPELLLNQILLEAEKCEWLEESIRVAAKYYLSLIKSVSVSVQKILTKTLDLNDIFSDAFDFSLFTTRQFDAYHIFWTYVSGHTQELLALPAFDFWMNNNKRGEFTTKFLAALSITPEVPQEILDDIDVLKPLVQTENGGALDV